MKIKALVSDTGRSPHDVGKEYPFVAERDGWRVGDRVAYKKEYVRSGAGAKEWRGVILSCSGDPASSVGAANFLVFEPTTGEAWYQHPHFLRRLRG